MPLVQSTGSYSVGRDCQVVLMHPLAPGGRVDLPNVTGFMANQVTVNVKSDRLDGVQLAAELPKGWAGEFDADRGNNGLDVLFAAIEAAWYSTGNTPTAIIFQYVLEPDGSTTTFQYTQASLKLSAAGHWQGDQIVKQKISFEAWRRNKV